MAYTGANGQIYILAPTSFASGGEGEIFEIPAESGKLAKLYHKNIRSVEREKKLKYMIENPLPASGRFTGMVAWPKDLIYENGKFAGFIMDRLNVGKVLSTLYRYATGQQAALTSQKVIIAQNICAVSSEVNKAGFVIGDFNPQNIGVDTQNGHVVFLDTDSWHIYDKVTGDTYRCNVCLDGYVAPEVLTACKSGDTFETMPLPSFTEYSDRFSLAIHIFRLTMNGLTPYCGLDQGTRISQAAPSIGNDSVRRDEYCFKPGKVPTTKLLPDRSTLSDEMLVLFERAFIDGRKDPTKRPDADEWYDALENYRQTLKPCAANPSHEFMNTLANCPLCEADNQFQNALKNAASAGSQPVITTNPIHLPSPHVGIPPGRGMQNTPTPIVAPFVGIPLSSGYIPPRWYVPPSHSLPTFGSGLTPRPVLPKSRVNKERVWLSIRNFLMGATIGIALAVLIIMLCAALTKNMNVAGQWTFVSNILKRLPNGVWEGCGRYAPFIYLACFVPILIALWVVIQGIPPRVGSILGALTLVFCIGFALVASIAAFFPAVASIKGINSVHAITLIWAVPVTAFIGLLSGKIKNLKVRVMIAISFSFLFMLIIYWFQSTWVFSQSSNWLEAHVF